MTHLETNEDFVTLNYREKRFGEARQAISVKTCEIHKCDYFELNV